MTPFKHIRLAYLDDLANDPEIDKMIKSDKWIDASIDGYWVPEVMSEGLPGSEKKSISGESPNIRFDGTGHMVGKNLAIVRVPGVFNGRASKTGEGARYYYNPSHKFCLMIDNAAGYSSIDITKILNFTSGQLEDESITGRSDLNISNII